MAATQTRCVYLVCRFFDVRVRYSSLLRAHAEEALKIATPKTSLFLTMYLAKFYIQVRGNRERREGEGGTGGRGKAAWKGRGEGQLLRTQLGGA